MNQKKHKNQRGSALLISLGILSLALILAMSFAFSARTSRQVAKVNADITRANLMAITAEDRIIAAMKLAYGRQGRYITGVGMATTDEECLFPNAASASINFNSNTWTDSDEHVQHYARPSSTADGDGNNPDSILRQHSSYYTALSSQLPSGQTFVEGYQPVYKSSDGTGTIIGRIAYVLLDETQKYDINRFQDIQLDSTHNPVAPIIATGEYNLAALNTSYNVATHFFYQMGLSLAGNTTLTHINKQRLGVLPQEIWYSNRSTYTPTLTGYMGYTRLPWQSYTHLYNAKGSFDYAKFTFFSPREPESFASVTSGNFAEEYHRFDLTGFEVGGTSYWDSSDFTVESLTAGTRASFGKETDSSFATTKATCIYSLARMADKNGTNVSKHVAANLIDYADSNNYATFPPNSGDDAFNLASPTAPAYCGNEKVAYINEMPLRFSVLRERNTDDDYVITVDVTGGLELANVFKNESVPVGALAFRIEGSYAVHYTDASETSWKNGDFAPSTPNGWETNTDVAGNLDSDKTFVQYVFTTNPGTSTNAHVFTPINVFQETSPGIEDTTDSSKKHAYALKLDLTVKKVVAYHAESLGDQTKIFDLAYWEGEKTFSCNLPGVTYNPSATTANEVDDGDKEIYLYNSLEAQDPRCNHRSDFWDWHNSTCSESSIDFDYSAPLHSSWQAINANTTTLLASANGTDYDKETVAQSSLDLKDISTNYIANRSTSGMTGKILSFWELGAIHRAEPFRTIRLSQYEKYADGENITYEKGDAVLLDEVKIGPAKFNYGKFNCNCQDAGNFGYFRPGLSPDDTYDNICENKWAENQCVTIDSHSVSFSRGSLADHFHFKTGSPNYINTDCQAESVIGRTANLFSTRSNYYTIFIVAQPLQQLDNAGITSGNWNDVKKTITNPTSMGSNYFSILGTAIWQLGVVRDAWKNEFQVVYRENLVK